MTEQLRREQKILRVIQNLDYAKVSREQLESLNSSVWKNWEGIECSACGHKNVVIDGGFFLYNQLVHGIVQSIPTKWKNSLKKVYG